MDYIVADPTKNITVLIRSPYTDENRGEMISNAFRLVPDCEQAGFVMPVSAGHVKLEMMGYEFCANASLSAASWKAYADGLGIGESATVLLDSSGVSEPLTVKVKRIAGEKPSFFSSMMLSEPEVGEFSGYPVVHMDGISHMILPAESFSDEKAESSIKGFAAALDVPALGMILISAEDADSVHIRPLVYVRDSDTLVWEQGCGSGSTAVGCYRYHKNRIQVTDVVQPGGVIRITVKDGVPELSERIVLRSGY